MSENKDICVDSRDPVQAVVSLTTATLQVAVKIEEVNPDGSIVQDSILKPEENVNLRIDNVANVNGKSTLCNRLLKVNMYRLPDFILQLFMEDTYRTISTPFSAEADLGLHSELDIKFESEELNEEASNCSEECVHAAAAAGELAVCHNGSGSVKTEQLEQIIHEDEQNDNSTNENKCTNAVDEETAATASQTNTDRTSTFADLKLKRIVTADTDVEVKGIDMERSSLLNSANNYTPRNKKTGLTCETKEINTTSNKGSNAPDAFKKLNDILLRCKYNNCGAGAVTDHNSDSSLENEYSCTLCNYATNDAGAFECHSGVHSATSQYICDTCSYVTTEKNILIRHMRSHADGNPFGRKILSIKRLVKIQTDKISYSCKLCTKKFTYRSNLNKHIRIHTGDKPYTCEICDIKFMSRSGLEYHIRTHTGEKRFACKLCDKKFTHKSNLISHSKTHTGEKSFACQICDKKFARKDHLLSHNTTHSGNEPYACKICDKKYVSSNGLLYHIRTHTGEKRFACKICDKMFAQNSHLLSHIRTHTADKPYVCKICDKKFTYKSSLNTHIFRIHTCDKYACKICDKKFADSYSFKAHTKIHTGENMFICNLCDKEFTHRSKLITHFKTHTGEKSFACEFCDRKFAYNHCLIVSEHILAINHMLVKYVIRSLLKTLI